MSERSERSELHEHGPAQPATQRANANVTYRKADVR